MVVSALVSARECVCVNEFTATDNSAVQDGHLSLRFTYLAPNKLDLCALLGGGGPIWAVNEEQVIRGTCGGRGGEGRRPLPAKSEHLFYKASISEAAQKGGIKRLFG